MPLPRSEFKTKGLRADAPHHTAIVQAREALGLTRIQAAQLCATSPRNWRFLESGLTRMLPRTYQRLLLCIEDSDARRLLFTLTGIEMGE